MKTIVDYARKVKEQHALSKNLAPVEADASASSKAYAIGQHFILNGELYKAKTAIALGDALVLDTNYEAAGSIEAQIETLDAENQTLTNKLDDEVEARAKLGAHNLLPHDAITSASTVQGVTYTPNSSDFSISISGTAAATNGQYISNSKLYAGTYKIRFEATGTLNDNTKLFFMAKLCQADGTSINNDYVSIHPNEEVTVTIEGTNYLTAFRLFTLAGAAFTNSYKIKPLIKLASDPSTAYAPYAMTNRELTENVNGNYIYEGYTDVSIEPDTTSETISTALVKLFNAGNTFLGTLDHDNEFAVLETLRLGNYITMKTAYYGEKKYNSGAGMTFSGMAFTDSYGSIWNYLVLLSATPKVTRYKVSSSGLTNSEQIGGNSATDMGTFALKFKKYRKIV